MILDIFMLAQVIFSVYIMASATKQPCQDLSTRLYVSILSFLLLLRVSHLLVICCFFTCFFPCYLCADGCCCKRWLVNSKGLSSQAMASLYQNWTWVFKPSKAMANQGSRGRQSNRFST